MLDDEVGAGGGGSLCDPTVRLGPSEAGQRFLLVRPVLDSVFDCHGFLAWMLRSVLATRVMLLP